MNPGEDPSVPLAESPSSRFTAVNEKEQPTIVVSMNGAGGNGAPRRTPPDDRARSQTMMPPPPKEKLTITTSPTQREEWISPPNGERSHYHHPTTPYPDSDASTHKRKRSADAEQNSPPPANSYHNHGLPTSAKPTSASTDSEGGREDSERGQPQSDSRDPYSADSRYGPYLSSAEESRESAQGGDPWHTRQYPQQGHISSDEHIGEVLQRASQNIDAQQRRDYEQSSPNDDDRSANTSSYSPYGSDRREISTQADLKKRKRNFSNRTKTGCMTCRRRKKKCDEARPECNNCLRGGFVCSGYQQRGQWPKPDQKPAPIPLQSKSDYDKAGYSQPTFIAPPPPNPQRREPLPGYRGQSLRVDPHHGRRINIDDDQPSSGMTSSASTASPEKNRLSAISFSGQTATPITASSSAYPDRNIKSPYDRIGPLHDITRQEGRSDLDTPQSAQSQSSSLPPLLNPQIHNDSPRANPQVAAQLALSNLASSNVNRPRTQKEEMLAERHYFPFDKELVLERERCSAACWRFNNCINPNNRVSPEERSKLFRDILRPRDQVVSPSEASPLSRVGQVGDNVVVEAPFSCDYGYNITIGEDVAIGKNCTILDTCDVVIGDRCNIGPNVNIYTATLPVDPKKRLGSRGPNLGRKITIGPDCWIGGGATILPGRTIGKGSTVGAGSIVTRDVPPYTVVCGNPARVIRGLYGK